MPYLPIGMVMLLRKRLLIRITTRIWRLMQSCVGRAVDGDAIIIDRRTSVGIPATRFNCSRLKVSNRTPLALPSVPVWLIGKIWSSLMLNHTSWRQNVFKENQFYCLTLRCHNMFVDNIVPRRSAKALTPPRGRLYSSIIALKGYSRLSPVASVKFSISDMPVCLGVPLGACPDLKFC